MKHIPVSVVAMDIPTRWIETCLTGVGRVDRLDAGTSDIGISLSAGPLTDISRITRMWSGPSDK